MKSKARTNKRLLWGVVALVVVAAGLCAALALGGRDEIRLVNGVLTGIEDGWIVGKLPEGYRKLAQVSAPEGYHLSPGASANSTSAEPEIYYAPDDEASPVDFIFYTSGAAAAQTLAQTAAKAYDAFYDDYLATDIRDDTLDGKDACWFSYTCSYPNRDSTARVYAQSAVGYFPVAWPDACVVAIVSMTFDDPGAYQSDNALRSALQTAAGRIELEAKP